MNHSNQPKKKSKADSNNSLYHQYKPVILGMGGGVLLGIVMGTLLEDPALGIAFGLAVGGGYWYTLEKITH